MLTGLAGLSINCDATMHVYGRWAQRSDVQPGRVTFGRATLCVLHGSGTSMCAVQSSCVWFPGWFGLQPTYLSLHSRDLRRLWLYCFASRGPSTRRFLFSKPPGALPQISRPSPKCCDGIPGAWMDLVERSSLVKKHIWIRSSPLAADELPQMRTCIRCLDLRLALPPKKLPLSSWFSIVDGRMIYT